MNLVITVDNLEKVMVSTRADYETGKEVYPVKDYTDFILDKHKYNPSRYLSYSAILALEKELEFVVDKFRKKEDYITKLTINASKKLKEMLLVENYEGLNSVEGYDAAFAFGQAFKVLLPYERKVTYDGDPNCWKKSPEVVLIVNALAKSKAYLCELLGVDKKGNEIEGSDAIEVSIVFSDADPVLNYLRYNLTYKENLVKNNIKRARNTRVQTAAKAANKEMTKRKAKNNKNIRTGEEVLKSSNNNRVAENKKRKELMAAKRRERLERFNRSFTDVEIDD